MTTFLPSAAGEAREKAILDFIRSGDWDPVDWQTITSNYNGHTAEFSVFGDALKIRDVRVNVTATTQQAIADYMDCMFLTPKLADLMWEQRAITIPPFPQGASKDMGSTDAMLRHSVAIDQALDKQGSPSGLIGTFGKLWVLDNELLKLPNRAMNYGWHFVGQSFQGASGEVTASRLQDGQGRYQRIIQGRGTRHDRWHVDYSQVCALVSMNCVVDGQDRRLNEILQDPQLAPLANLGGRLDVLRQPGT